MTKSKLVSVIIPSYNHEKFLFDAIKSVLDQSYINLELIIIDDGSKDNSVNILKSIQDPRFSFYVQENQGAHNAINKGLSIAKGEYLTILNSDDIFSFDRIEKLVQILEMGDYDLVSTWIQIIDSNSKDMGVKQGWDNCEPWVCQKFKENIEFIDDFSLNLISTNFVSTTSNIFFKRSIYDDLGGMRNFRFVHDWDFLLRVAFKYKCYLYNEPLLKYRIHNSNTISSNKQWMIFEICMVWAIYLEFYIDNFVSKNSKFLNYIDKFYKSINFQGNENLYMILNNHLRNLRYKGFSNPEIIIIEDKGLLEKYKALVIVPNSVKVNYVNKLLKRLYVY